MDNSTNAGPSEGQIDGLEIFESWDMYERIIHGNWMCHRELRSVIQETLGTELSAIRVLDVGSGDGRMAHDGLAHNQVAKYVALDLSHEALSRLQQRPSPGTNSNTCERQVICGDFTQTIGSQPNSTFDLVLCSYSLHHLKLEQKCVMLKGIARVMAPLGRLFWIDAFRMDGETREQYLTRLGEYISRDWTSLSEAEREDAVDHIWNSDFPETEKLMLQLLADTGFTEMSRVWSDAFFGMWKARKSVPA